MVVENLNAYFFKVQRLVKVSHPHQITPPARGSGMEGRMEGTSPFFTSGQGVYTRRMSQRALQLLLFKFFSTYRATKHA